MLNLWQIVNHCIVIFTEKKLYLKQKCGLSFSSWNAIAAAHSCPLKFFQQITTWQIIYLKNILYKIQ